MIGDVAVVMFSYGRYTQCLSQVIDSFNGLADHFYVLSFDSIFPDPIPNTRFIDLADYDYSMNRCANQIIGYHDIVFFWKPYYILNTSRTKELLEIMNNKRFSATYIYGLNLVLDVRYYHSNKKYAANGGGCFILRNNVAPNNPTSSNVVLCRLQEEHSMFRINNKLYDVDYRLSERYHHMFYSVVYALDPMMILQEYFETQYIDYLFSNPKKYLTFGEWYQENKKTTPENGARYVEKQLVADQRLVLHGLMLPRQVLTLNRYLLDPGKARTIDLKGKYHDYSITIVTLVRNNHHYLKESMGSLIKQTSDKWKCILVNDGSTEPIKYEHFLTKKDLHYRDRFTIINLKEWNGLVRCHKLALMHVTTDIVGILDVDDALEPSAIKDVVDLYNATKKDNVFVCTNFYYCDHDLSIRSLGYAQEIKTSILNDRCINHFRNFKLKHYYLTKGYDDDLQFGGEDQDIFFKLETVCTPIFLNKPVYRYRQNINSISSLKKLSRHSLNLSILKNIKNRSDQSSFLLNIFSPNSSAYHLSRTPSNRNNTPLQYQNKDLFAELYINGTYYLSIQNSTNIEYWLDQHLEKLKSSINPDVSVFEVKVSWDVSKSSHVIEPHILVDMSVDQLDRLIESMRMIHPNIYFDNVYVLNLSKDTVKRERITRIFGGLGIRCMFFEAVYGKSEPYISQYNEKNLSSTLRSPGAYGYSLTTINIFKHAIENKYKKILVCDDDIILHNDFLNQFDRNIRTVPYDWSVLFFGLSGPWTHPYVNNDFKKFTYNDNLITDLSNCDGSYCVGYDLSILPELVRVAERFDAPFDTAIIRHLNSNPQIIKFAFYPYLVIADTTTSDISNREKNIIDNFSAYQFRYRLNINQYDLPSMLGEPYQAIISDPFPLVSIIVTVYNKSMYLKDSIRSLLNQTYRNIELIVVEDQSTDDSKNILQQIIEPQNNKRVICIYNPTNMGCYASRNIGVGNANGQVIAFHDADDYAISTRIEQQINIMRQTGALMVGGLMLRSHIPNIDYQSDQSILSDANRHIVPSHRGSNCCTKYFGYPTLIFKKTLFDRYGLYIEKKKGMDMEFPERVIFRMTGHVFDGDSWEFFNQSNSESSTQKFNILDGQPIYQKIDDLIVISPEMNQLNITNAIASDDFLIEKKWRKNYQ